MKAFAITNKGTEKTAAGEILELINSKTETEERLVKFQAKNYEDICKIIYLYCIDIHSARPATSIERRYYENE